jgi:hypothetical protein
MSSQLQREGVGLAVALALHAAVLFLMGRRPVPIGGVERSAPLEVEIEAAPTETAEAPRPVESPGLSERAPPVALARPTTPGPHALEGAHQPDESPPPASSNSAFVFNPMAPHGSLALSDDALGLAGRNRFLGAADAVGHDPRAEAPPDEAPRNVAPGIDESMRDALDARDHDLGLDVGGPIVRVAEELTRPSDAPMNGRAVFEVTIDADGNVGDVRLVDAVRDDRASWEGLGAQIGATLRARRIAWRLKPGHATAIRFEVSSRYALPSGQAPGRVVSKPFAGVQDEGATAGGHFDLSDIGKRPARDVHARILTEKRF